MISKGWPKRDTEDNRKWYKQRQNRQHNPVIPTFEAKGFLVYGPYENFINKHVWLSDFLKYSKAYLTLQKIKYVTLDGCQLCNPYFLTKKLPAIPLILNDDNNKNT